MNLIGQLMIWILVVVCALLYFGFVGYIIYGLVKTTVVEKLKNSKTKKQK
jgi:exopolysaccharide biosynthesis protein